MEYMIGNLKLGVGEHVPKVALSGAFIHTDSRNVRRRLGQYERVRGRLAALYDADQNQIAAPKYIWAVTAVDQGSGYFEISGLHASEFTAESNDPFRINGSTGNDGTYTYIRIGVFDAANGLLAHAEDRLTDGIMVPGRAFADDGAGTITLDHYADPDDEAENVARAIEDMLAGGYDANEIVCLYRTNAQAAPVEVALMKRGIKYRIAGHSFFQRAVATSTRTPPPPKPSRRPTTALWGAGRGGQVPARSRSTSTTSASASATTRNAGWARPWPTSRSRWACAATTATTTPGMTT